MSAVPSERRDGGKVIVRLSDVPAELRERVAGEIMARVEARGIRGIELLEWGLAAKGLRDATLRVPAEKADRVLRERKLPTGEMPKVWTW